MIDEYEKSYDELVDEEKQVTRIGGKKYCTKCNQYIRGSDNSCISELDAIECPIYYHSNLNPFDELRFD
jgi:hypothetical protein